MQIFGVGNTTRLIWGAIWKSPRMDVLELRWRSRAAQRQNWLWLRLLDGAVNVGALAKRRARCKQLNEVVRCFSARGLAMGVRVIFGFASSAKNPADAPSRLLDG